jgi:hypothetical protein
MGGSAGLCSPDCHSSGSPDRCAGADIAVSRANRRTQSGPHQRSNRSATGQVLIDGVIGIPSGLSLSPLPAGNIIHLE